VRHHPISVPTSCGPANVRSPDVRISRSMARRCCTDTIFLFDRNRPRASRVIPESGGMPRLSRPRNVLRPAPSHRVLPGSVANSVACVRRLFSCPAGASGPPRSSAAAAPVACKITGASRIGAHWFDRLWIARTPQHAVDMREIRPVPIELLLPFTMPASSRRFSIRPETT
jgi:hypothetical protein